MLNEPEEKTNGFRGRFLKPKKCCIFGVLTIENLLAMKKVIVLLIAFISLVIIGSCKSKDPAILKVFVRSSSNQLMSGAKVVVIGDQQSNPPTGAFVDTTYTNSSGFTSVDMDQYFNTSGPDNTTGYFDIVVKHNNKTATGYTRCRIHTTAVETIYLPN
jgi:hypothetical protein